MHRRRTKPNHYLDEGADARCSCCAATNGDRTTYASAIAYQ
jgi:hypothetical protein